MRGKEIRAALCSLDAGITPAYAGKSFHNFIFHKLFIGSPPPMRGKVKLQTKAARFDGITPAYAGKSPRVAWYTVYRGDHPRLCGEKATTRTSLSMKPGSPPPMRGKDSLGKPLLSRMGITPAYAGKSCKSDNLFSFL